MDSLSKKQQVILKPILSEKSLTMYRLNRVCTCLVNPKSTKKDISFAFNQVYGIAPLSVRTVTSRKTIASRNKRTYKTTLNRSYVKKAYIGIGDKTFDLYENIK
jgi:ribosomal protein L23